MLGLAPQGLSVELVILISAVSVRSGKTESGTLNLPGGVAPLGASGGKQRGSPDDHRE